MRTLNGAQTAPSGEFVVTQFFEDGSSEIVAKFVSPDEALAIVHRCMHGRSAVKITVTDSVDQLYAEWDNITKKMLHQGEDHDEES